MYVSHTPTAFKREAKEREKHERGEGGEAFAAMLSIAHVESSM